MRYKTRQISSILVFSNLLLVLFLAGCCEDDSIILTHDRMDAQLSIQNRKGYFRIAHLQVPAPSIAAGQWQPLALATDDWNHDGVLDLASAYAATNGGFLLLQSGNVGLHKGSSAVSETNIWYDSPFLAEAKLMEVPLRPDFLFAGDFNNDSFQDILIAQKNGSYLCWIAGDGRGEFHNASLIPLNGTITALRVAEFNRPIGISYILVGLESSNGSQLLIYKCNNQNPFTQHESYTLPAPISALEVGMLNSDGANDLAIVADGRLWVLMGNSNLVKQSTQQLKQIRLKFRVKALTAGNFLSESRKGLAVLSENGKLHAVKFLQGEKLRWERKQIARGAWPYASQLLRTRMTGNSLDDLAIFSGNKFELMSAATSARFEVVDTFDFPGNSAFALSVKLNRDALNDLVVLGNNNPVTLALTQPQVLFSVNIISDESDADTLDGVCDIDLGTPESECTLRAAIEQANASPGLDDISFGQLLNPTIAPLSPLPVITDPVLMNDELNADLVELTGLNPSAAASHGLVITGGNSIIHRFVINRFNGSPFAAGILLDGNTENEISECLIGTDSTGMMDLGNSFGVLINNSTANEISGFFNPSVISGNLIGVQIQGTSEQNEIKETKIGTTIDGIQPLGNSNDGIFVLPLPGNTFISNNVISGNGGSGIRIYSGGIIGDNKIGVNVDGNADLGNAGIGISIVNDSNFVGPTSANVISGNGSAGIAIQGDDNRIEQNFIGTDQTGTLPLGNDAGGILIQDGNQNQIELNTIAHNNTGTFGAGIRVTLGELGSVENLFSQNQIHSNSGLGIDLGGVGVTPNDNGDGDNGPNGLQNFPVITSATSNDEQLGIEGALNSSPNQSFSIEFFGGPNCDNSGNGEGQLYLGSLGVSTDTNGDGTFAVSFPGIPVGYFVTATASRLISTPPLSTGETSEFSACFQVETPSSGFDCDIFGPDDPMPGEDVFVTGIVYDENNVGAPDVPVIFRIQTPSGVEQIDGAVTDTNGAAQSPPFSSLYPEEFTLSMEGDGFSCQTTVEFTYCQESLGIGLSLTGFTEELSRIRTADPDLDQLTRRIEEKIKTQLSGGSIQLTQSQLQIVIDLIDRYAEKADLPLRKELFQIQDLLRDPEALKSRGILVSQ